jgi:hypothetical protein
MVKVVNVRKADPKAFNIYIGRESFLSKDLFQKKPWLKNGTVLGNPVKLKGEHTRGDSLEAHKEYFYKNLDKLEPILEELIQEGSKRTVCLACWCHPKPCHGDVIAAYLNEKISGPVPEIISEDIFEE